jgi:hypothetical protein
METMGKWTLLLVWIGCVLIGAAVGFGIGWVLWQLGLELIGSSVALVGAGVGGIAVFFWFLQWSDDHQSR